MRDDKRPVFRLAATGLLAALAIALSFLEGLLPVLPIPGAKLGLSNLATMTALSLFGFPAALGVTAVKALFALLRGGAAFWMSLAGGLLSTLVMAACFRFFSRRVGLIGTGILGAVAHNGGQLLVATLLFDTALLYYAPFLLLAAVVAGTLTGLVLQLIFPKLHTLLKG